MQHQFDIDVRVEPVFSQWSSMVSASHGELFGRPLTSWRTLALQSLGLPFNKPIVVVGHQPIFFHPGILAKFITGHIIAAQMNGVLVYLVVDHHVGSSGVIEIPQYTGDHLSIGDIRIAAVDPHVAMKDQDPVTILEALDPFTHALEASHGTNAAMQFAYATNLLMEPWAVVQHTIASSDLLQTEVGKAIIKEMNRDPRRCIDAYNEAVIGCPNCGIALLEQNELPLWHGKYNARVHSTNDDLRPRALLLTLLARVMIGDLFVHGTGGALYDKIMEQWLQSWLGIDPCEMTMATASLTLPPHHRTIDEARKHYFSPVHESETKSTFVDSIASAPYQSSMRQDRFQAMHKWLSSKGVRPDVALYKRAHRIANRRDWAFSLYPHEMLDQLRDALINT